MRSLNKAIRITEHVFAELPLMSGMRENELAGWIRREMRKMGAHREAFRAIVASGWRSSLVHGFASHKRIAPKDVVMIDIGAKVDGHHADITRTYFLTKPTAYQKKIYKLVLKAQKAAIKKVKAGVPCREIDKAARDILHKAGFGHYFKHTTGHGVGKKIHESPKISPKNRNKLRAGQIITIEPGVYLKNWGIRIEDMVQVTKKGCRILTRVPK